MADTFAYKEPGVVVKQIIKPRTSTPLPFQVPVIIGEGLAYRTYTNIPIVRGADGVADVLPCTTATNIIGTGKVRNIFTYTSGQSSLVEPNEILWTAGNGAPLEGDTYYVTFEARPEESQYDLKIIRDFSDLDDQYEGFFMSTDMIVNGALEKVVQINPMYTAVYLALESGVKAVYAQQVKPSGTVAGPSDIPPANPFAVVEAIDYRNVLDNSLAYQQRIYRVCPLTMNSTVTSQVVDHINVLSDPEEKMERACILAVDTSSDTTLDALIGNVTTQASSYHNRRVILTYADSVTKKLSDGTFHDLPPFYLNAALAGVEGFLSAQNSLTNFELRNFTKLNVRKMKRRYKNVLAGAGVTIFEQADENEPIIVRDWLTTDQSNPNASSGSVTSIDDYIAKFLRARLNPIIGKYNITADTIERITKTTQSALDDLKKSGIITSGEITGLFQDEDNPKRILLSIGADPAYPCDRIEVNLLLG